MLELLYITLIDSKEVVCVKKLNFFDDLLSFTLPNISVILGANVIGSGFVPILPSDANTMELYFNQISFNRFYSIDKKLFREANTEIVLFDTHRHISENFS